MFERSRHTDDFVTLLRKKVEHLRRIKNENHDQTRCPGQCSRMCQNGLLERAPPAGPTSTPKTSRRKQTFETAGQFYRNRRKKTRRIEDRSICVPNGSLMEKRDFPTVTNEKY